LRPNFALIWNSGGKVERINLAPDDPPIGNCVPGSTLSVNLNISPGSQVTTNTRMQLSGNSDVNHVTRDCEFTQTTAEFTWSLTFQPPGGAETDATGLLVSANTLTPFFIPTLEGTFRVKLTGHAANLTPATITRSAVITVVLPPPVLLNAQGKLTLLRVHDLGTGFGPPTDFIDVEAVVQLDSQPGKSFGFQLRNDRNRPARQGMLDLMRDAFTNKLKVSIDFLIVQGKSNGVIIRSSLLQS
jgi:hypothetical protein